MLLLALVSCNNGTKSEEFFRSWQDISRSDTLRVGTMTSPQDFYIFRGEPGGNEYQKVSDFAEEYNLQLDIRIARSMDSLLLWLSEGTIDICITPIAMTKSNTETFDFGGIVDTSSLVLVQKKKECEELLSTLSDMGHKDVWTEHNGVGNLRLRQIEEEIGERINIHTSDTLSVEEVLMAMVKSDTIDYAISDVQMANLFCRYYPQLDGSLQISVPIRYCWALAKGNLELKQVLDAHFLRPDIEAHYDQLKLKGSYLHQYISSEAKQHKKLPLPKGAISPFDQLFKQGSDRLPWHWTLLASIAYQESNFKSDIIGFSGARGLMGIMPSTGRAFGASQDELLSPEISVRVASDCLLATRRYFLMIHDPHEQLCFTLAAYNAGVGHIQDAQRLAKKYHAPDTIWMGGVREYVLLKSNSEYYNDPVVRNGYLRGRETVNYVDEVMERQAIYLAHIQKK